MNRTLLVCCLVSAAFLGGCRPYVDTYESCYASADCLHSSDSCITLTNGAGRDEVCTTGCSTDADCPVDNYGARGVCSVSGTGSPVCLQHCTSDRDCYGAFVCAAEGVCLPRPGGAVGGTVQNYRSCVVSSDCRTSTLECVRFNVGGAVQDVCTRSGCTTDADCPIDARGGNGLCLSFDGGATRACWERCNIRGDCENTFEWDCTTNVGGFTVPAPGVCAPR